MVGQTNVDKKVILNGNGLTLDDFIAVTRQNAQVVLAAEAVERMTRSRAVVEGIVAKDVTAYGITTGFGKFSNVHIQESDANQLQNNLILSHCTGCGDPYPQEVVRGMLLLRANALCKGFSGIRFELVETFVEMLNRGVHPVVPQKGSLGASGDLVPLAHMTLPLLGLGEAIYNGEKMPGGRAMELAGLPRFTLEAKEGLALINGTQAMTSVGAHAFYDTLHAAQLADIIASLTMEALFGQLNAFEDRVQAVRPHPGQRLVAANMRALCAGSALLDFVQETCVQDAYALRCVPQVHGAIRGALDHVLSVLSVEFNAVTDNPLVFADDDAVISGGNFHGEPLALALDYLGIACAEIANISERRLERLVNHSLSKGLPAFLTPNGGLHSGFMICQYTAASMVSENKVLAHPASVDSIPSSANQEDHVSMGATAARKAGWIAQNTLSVLGLELMAAAQALDFRMQKTRLSLSPVHERLYRRIRQEIPFLSQDCEMRLYIPKIEALVRSEELTGIVKQELPDFA